MACRCRGRGHGGCRGFYCALSYRRLRHLYVQVSTYIYAHTHRHRPVSPPSFSELRLAKLAHVPGHLSVRRMVRGLDAFRHYGTLIHTPGWCRAFVCSEPPVRADPSCPFREGHWTAGGRRFACSSLTILQRFQHASTSFCSSLDILKISR